MPPSLSQNHQNRYVSNLHSNSSVRLNQQHQYVRHRTNGSRDNHIYSRTPSMISDPLGSFKLRKDRERKRLLDAYDILGYIAAGTYGKVYKANSKDPALRDRLYAIKKFKADKEGGIVHYTGISQSACREMALCREMNHNNVINLIDVFLEDKSIFIIFDYAEHDLLQIIHYHTHPDRKAIPESIIKSVLWQILNGVSYLHQNWVLHRDLKPANIMLSSDGVVKIGDLGLARLFSDPLQTLYSGDKIVVTIWYRAPELLLGARHYTPAIDLWAVGCILGELLALKPIFKGEEAKLDNKKQAPFPRSQFQKVIDVLGSPTVDKWPSLPNYPEFQQLQAMKKLPSNVTNWYQRHVISQPNPKAFNLFTSLLEYDPAKRITADDTLSHEYFRELPRVTENVFAGQNYEYPSRRISNDDNNIKATNNNNNNSSAYQTATNKRQAANDYSDPLHSRKKQR